MHFWYRSLNVVALYCVQCCKSEAPRHIKDAHIPEGWPKSGAITFQNYKMRYRENTPIVLNRLNFLIQAGEKLGIVGRTGSGKILYPVFDTLILDRCDLVKMGNSENLELMCCMCLEQLLGYNPPRSEKDQLSVTVHALNLV